MQEYLNQFISAPLEFAWLYIIPFVLVLSVLVFVHEWGHYIVARMCGVRVEVFSIGFGREIFGRTDKNGTRWKFSMIPLGGYVQMFGDADPASAGKDEKVKKFTKAEKKVAFYSQSIPRRAAIVFAGPAINYIFAAFLLAGLFVFHGQPQIPPVAAKLMEGAPAEAAGIQVDDKIVEIDGRAIETFQDIVNIVSVNLGEEMNVVVHRSTGEVGQWDAENPVAVKITPDKKETKDRFGFVHSKGQIGIMSPPSDSALKKHTVWSGTVAAVAETWHITASTLKALGQMFTGERSTKELGGIIKIGAYAGEFAQAGLVSLITFSALLSVNLGFINLLPIPMLDGGHLAMYGVEAAKGSPMSDNAQEYAFRAGFAFVIFFMLFATWNDLVQLQVFDYIINVIS